MLFQKQDIEQEIYQWRSEEDKQLYLGQPSRRAFNRFNGDQVLFLINFYGSLTEHFTLQEGKKIEHKLLHLLPTEVKSEISVFNWIRNDNA